MRYIRAAHRRKRRERKETHTVLFVNRIVTPAQQVYNGIFRDALVHSKGNIPGSGELLVCSIQH